MLDVRPGHARRAAARRDRRPRTGRWTCWPWPRTPPFAAGTAAEDEALADLVMSEELRSGLYAFDLVQRRAKRPVGAPDLDAGPAGHQGRHRRGRPDGEPARAAVRPAARGAGGADRPRPGPARQGTVLCVRRDRQAGRQGPARRRAGRPSCAAWSPAASTRPRSPTPTWWSRRSSRTSTSRSRSGPSWRRSSRPECVLATNTSSLSVTAMAADLDHPERVVGLHFFNPVALMPLLEIVRAERTDDATLATAFAVGKALRKSCVLVKDAPAFVVNRLLTRFQGAVFGAIEAGTPIDVADAALDPLGLPMRPLDAAAAGRSGRRVPRGRHPARGVPGPVRGQREHAPHRRVRPAAAGRRRRSTRRWPSCSRSATRRCTPEQVRDDAR